MLANYACVEKTTHKNNKQTIRIATNSSMRIANFAAIIRRRFFLLKSKDEDTLTWSFVATSHYKMPFHTLKSYYGPVYGQ